MPGFRNAPDPIKIVIAFALTVSMFPVWPTLQAADPSVGQITSWVFQEAGFGLMSGVAGYGYALAIDPNSQADSSVLQVFFSLAIGLLFFTLGIDHALIRILAASYRRFPPGAWSLTFASADAVLKLGGSMWATGFRLALPVGALLLLIDISLALMGRMHQQLQLLSLAFPVKMLAALGLLIALVPVVPRLLSDSPARTLSVLRHVAGL